MSESKKAPVQNTHLTEEELNHFRTKLLEEKETAEREIQEMKESYNDLTKTVRIHSLRRIITREILAAMNQKRRLCYLQLSETKRNLKKLKLPWTV